MSARGAKLLSLRASPPASVLVLWGLLVGCAGAPGKPGVLPSAASARPRMLRASSDLPGTGGNSAGSPVRGYEVPGRNPNSQAPLEVFCCPR